MDEQVAPALAAEKKCCYFTNIARNRSFKWYKGMRPYFSQENKDKWRVCTQGMWDIPPLEMRATRAKQVCTIFTWLPCTKIDWLFGVVIPKNDFLAYIFANACGPSREYSRWCLTKQYDVRLLHHTWFLSKLLFEKCVSMHVCLFVHSFIFQHPHEQTIK